MTNENENETVLNPKILGVVEIPKIDFNMYHGKTAKIQSIEFKNSQYGIYAFVKTFPIADVDDNNDVYATKLLNLYEKKDEEGNVLGHGWGEDSKTGLFMKKMSCEDFDQLIGKDVLVLHEHGKNNKEYLTF